jgi:hypothetical protein
MTCQSCHNDTSFFGTKVYKVKAYTEVGKSLNAEPKTEEMIVCQWCYDSLYKQPEAA